MRFLLIANPENRRVDLFQQALTRLGFEPAHVVSYAELLAGRRRLTDELRPGDIVRLDSPGENFSVERELLRAGCAEAEREADADRAAGRTSAPVLSEREIDSLTFDHGLILRPRQWYLGFRTLLASLERQLAEVSSTAAGLPLLPLSSPAEISVMFDKPACHRRCLAGQTPLPPCLEEVRSFDELIERMRAAEWRRVFVKPAHGSSASGVVALVHDKRTLRAVTSVELAREGGATRLYNSLRLSAYTRLDDVRLLIDTLTRDRVHVERWLPKASLGGRVCDVRIVVIAGRARHFVVRTSRSPITNLHLGNRRGDPAALLAALGPDRWHELQAACERTAALFPGSLQVALDVLLTPGFHRHFVLELNAFGDLLPGVLADGHDTYAAQILAARRMAAERFAP